MYESHFKVTLM